MRNRGTLRPSQSGSALIPAGGKLGVTSVPLFSGSLRDPAWDTKGFGPSFPMTKLWRAAPAASVEAGSPWADSQYSRNALRSEEHTSELQSLMRISYAVFCLKKKNKLT